MLGSWDTAQGINMSVLGSPAQVSLMPVTCKFPEDAYHDVEQTFQSLCWTDIGRSEISQKLLDDDQEEDKYGAGKFTWKTTWAVVNHRGRLWFRQSSEMGCIDWNREDGGLCAGDYGFLK